MSKGKKDFSKSFEEGFGNLDDVFGNLKKKKSTEIRPISSLDDLQNDGSKIKGGEAKPFTKKYEERQHDKHEAQDGVMQLKPSTYSSIKAEGEGRIFKLDNHFTEVSSSQQPEILETEQARAEIGKRPIETLDDYTKLEGFEVKSLDEAREDETKRNNNENIPEISYDDAMDIFRDVIKNNHRNIIGHKVFRYKASDGSYLKLHKPIYNTKENIKMEEKHNGKKESTSSEQIKKNSKTDSEKRKAGRPLMQGAEKRDRKFTFNTTKSLANLIEDARIKHNEKFKQFGFKLDESKFLEYLISNHEMLKND